MRSVAGLVLAFVILLAADWRMERAQRQVRLQAGTVERLVSEQLEPRIVDVETQDGEWRYVLKQGVWRFPAYHDAFVAPQRMEVLLRTVRGCTGTPADEWLEHPERYGLDAQSALQVTLRDLQGRVLAAVVVGYPTPASGGRECFVRLAGQDRVYHAHTNPRRALGHPVQPLVDLRVLPAGLGIGRVTAVAVLQPDGAESVRVWRIRDGLMGAPGRQPESSWRLEHDGYTRDGVDRSVEAYIAYLRRLQFTRLHSPAEFRPDKPPRFVVLTDQSGRRDTVEAGQSAEQGATWIRLRTTGHSGTMPQNRVELLFPDAATLLDTLHTPARYEGAAADSG